MKLNLRRGRGLHTATVLVCARGSTKHIFWSVEKHERLHLRRFSIVTTLPFPMFQSAIHPSSHPFICTCTDVILIWIVSSGQRTQKKGTSLWYNTDVCMWYTCSCVYKSKEWKDDNILRHNHERNEDNLAHKGFVKLVSFLFEMAVFMCVCACVRLCACVFLFSSPCFFSEGIWKKCGKWWRPIVAVVAEHTKIPHVKGGVAHWLMSFTLCRI